MNTRIPPFNLVNWPVSDSRYQETGENGMYAYAVITRSDTELGTACHVDARAHLSLPDLCVNPGSHCLWPGYASTDPDDTDRHSEALWSAVYLGSTGSTLTRRDGGGYFTVTADDLTLGGTALFEALSAAYSGGVTLLTFLDT